MTKQALQPIEDAGQLPDQPDNAPQPLPAILQDPQAGGCYTRDPITGALSLDTPTPQNT